MEKPFSGVSATGREELEVIGVRGQNIEIFIKSVKFQDLTLLFPFPIFQYHSLDGSQFAPRKKRQWNRTN
jgi:hypothetical protein